MRKSGVSQASSCNVCVVVREQRQPTLIGKMGTTGLLFAVPKRQVLALADEGWSCCARQWAQASVGEPKALRDEETGKGLVVSVRGCGLKGWR